MNVQKRHLQNQQEIREAISDFHSHESCDFCTGPLENKIVIITNEFSTDIIHANCENDYNEFTMREEWEQDNGFYDNHDYDM